MRTWIILIEFFIGVHGKGTQKLFEIRKWENCPGKKLIDVTIDVNQTNMVPNKIFYSAHLDVLEKVPGPLEIAFEASQCDHSFEKCEKYNGFKFPGICGLFKSASGPFAASINAFKPRLNCPLQPGRYSSPNSVIDVSPFAPLPIDGYVWVATIKGSAGEGKNRKLALCLLLEVKISLFKDRRNRN